MMENKRGQRANLIIYEDFRGETMDYKQLFEEANEDLYKEREQHNHTIAEAIVKQVELQPLKPDSVYVVKFKYNIKPYEMGELLRKLNEATESKNITFIPSCDYFEIVGEAND